VKTLRDYEEGAYIFVTYFAKEFAEKQWGRNIYNG